MALTVEDFKLFKDKLLNEYSKEQLDALAHMGVESIREYIKPIVNGDRNAIYHLTYPILDEFADKLKNNEDKHRIDTCIACEIRAGLRYLLKDINKK